MGGDIAGEAEDAELLEALMRGLACPRIGDYIFWSTDPNVTAEGVIDNAMAYEAITL
ncbi:hypothetical protein [Streptomyces sp. NPDC030920]|uniref:hypothetical protein n=1 Tax=Streptomyces sp. NPDC030920 TaxID=3365308 RepID=UPI00384CC638